MVSMVILDSKNAHLFPKWIVNSLNRKRPVRQSYTLVLQEGEIHYCLKID